GTRSARRGVGRPCRSGCWRVARSRLRWPRGWPARGLALRRVARWSAGWTAWGPPWQRVHFPPTYQLGPLCTKIPPTFKTLTEVGPPLHTSLFSLPSPPGLARFGRLASFLPYSQWQPPSREVSGPYGTVGVGGGCGSQGVRSHAHTVPVPDAVASHG